MFRQVPSIRSGGGRERHPATTAIATRIRRSIRPKSGTGTGLPPFERHYVTLWSYVTKVGGGAGPGGISLYYDRLRCRREAGRVHRRRQHCLVAGASNGTISEKVTRLASHGRQGIGTSGRPDEDRKRIW